MDLATIGILCEQEVVAGQLQVALNSRVVIEQAKGIVAERLQVTPDETVLLLRRFARDRNYRLTELAGDVIRGTAPIASQPAAPGRRERWADSRSEARRRGASRRVARAGGPASAMTKAGGRRRLLDRTWQENSCQVRTLDVAGAAIAAQDQADAGDLIQPLRRPGVRGAMRSSILAVRLAIRWVMSSTWPAIMRQMNAQWAVKGPVSGPSSWLSLARIRPEAMEAQGLADGGPSAVRPGLGRLASALGAAGEFAQHIHEHGYVVLRMP
ncbi:MAG: ANTAR domain-containing protein [Actinomycetota bacterium]|nr:ANTAR domain-containing protein [Actinomycetota bacterium]